MPHHDLPSTSAIPGRKCWKNIPKKTKDSRTEAVWSPVLEAALIEGRFTAEIVYASLDLRSRTGKVPPYDLSPLYATTAPLSKAESIHL
jgi:hypothetical protein